METRTIRVQLGKHAALVHLVTMRMQELINVHYLEGREVISTIKVYAEATL